MATRPFWSEYRILAWEPTTCGEKGDAQETRPQPLDGSRGSPAPCPARVSSAVWGRLLQISLLTSHRRASPRGSRLTDSLLGGDLLCVSVRPRPHLHLLPHPPQAQIFKSSGGRRGHLRHWVAGMRGSAEKHTCNHRYRRRPQSGWVGLDWEAQERRPLLGAGAAEPQAKDPLVQTWQRPAIRTTRPSFVWSQRIRPAASPGLCTGWSLCFPTVTPPPPTQPRLGLNLQVSSSETPFCYTASTPNPQLPGSSDLWSRSQAQKHPSALPWPRRGPAPSPTPQPGAVPPPVSPLCRWERRPREAKPLTPGHTAEKSGGLASGTCLAMMGGRTCLTQVAAPESRPPSERLL